MRSTLFCRRSILALSCLVAACLLAACLLAPTPAVAAGSRGQAVHRQGSRTLAELFQAELGHARKRNERLVLMFTADWCTPCKDIKRYVEGSAAVRKALAKGRMLYIDVDEWRGPAHALLPGINPTKLPTLVSVDATGKVLRTCYGTDLGLMSEDAVAHNLGRLLRGQAPEPPFYAGKPEVERELVLKYAQAQAARTQGVPQLEVSARGVRDGVRRVRLVIRNHDGPRRWFLVPVRADAPLQDKPTVRGWRQVRFTEHVRADCLRFEGTPGFVALPVAGYGAVTLDDWPLPGTARQGKLDVWELDRLTLDGQDQQFQMKLPYELTVAHPDQQAVTRQGGAAKVELRVRKKHTVKLP